MVSTLRPTDTWGRSKHFRVSPCLCSAPGAVRQSEHRPGFNPSPGAHTVNHLLPFSLHIYKIGLMTNNHAFWVRWMKGEDPVENLALGMAPKIMHVSYCY